MPAEPSVTLHIGPHKTGSTFIQLNLLRNRPALASAGLVYPDAFIMQFGHNSLRKEMESSPEAARALLATLVADLQSSGKSAIISSENLSLMDDSQMVALREALAPLPLRVVIFLRARGPTIWSQWQEHVKFGQGQGFSDYVAELVLRTPSANAIDPLGLAVRSQRYLGPVSLVDYDACVAEGKDLTLPVLEIASGKSLVLPDIDSTRVNSRMPQERVEILRLLNLIARQRLKRPPSNHVRKAFLSALRNKSEVKDATVKAVAMVRPKLVPLPLDLLDGYFAARDSEHAAVLRAAGTDVPPFGVQRGLSEPIRASFDYLPDTEILFSPLLPAVTRIYEMLEIGKD
jgi:hypothetical protein